MSSPDKSGEHDDNLWLNNFDLSEMLKGIEEAEKWRRKSIEQIATIRFPTIDVTSIVRTMETVTQAVRSGTEWYERHRAGIASSIERYQKIMENTRLILENGTLERMLKAAQDSMERISSIVPQSPSAFEMLEQHVLLKDFPAPLVEKEQFSNKDSSPAQEIILQSMELPPETIGRPTWNAKEPLLPFGRDAALPASEAAASVPTVFFQHVLLSETAKRFEILPEEADLIDEAIALYLPHKAGIFLFTQAGFWIKEEDGVTPQSIRIIQFFRRIGKRPGAPCMSAKELAKHLAPRGSSLKTGCSSIHNRIHRIQEICMEYNTKPILIKSGSLWRINPELTRWDNVGFMPEYHRKGH
ncbi:MAG: hypothetical protein WCV62_01570 [Candidatus Peribacteraceae bacterium]|jgi:hypothetical protein